VERLRFAEARAVQQQCNEHTAIVVPSGRAESLDNQFLEALVWESWRLTLFDLGWAATSHTVPGSGSGCVRRPRVSQKCLAPPVLVRGLICLPVEGAASVAGIYLRGGRPRFSKPIEEVG